ncbi:MAG: DUF3108 domain-containing protein [Reichenbachiella sp.]|uniref:DUF3108 domain-containing protein n=1 Tax=Reichenbachiella sp. TaxID=2184521 RepID=UPI003296CA71
MNFKFDKFIFFLTLFVSHTLFAQSNGVDNPSPKVENLKYKLKLGWFSIGSGEVTIDNDSYWRGFPCYKVGVYAETLGLGNWLGSLDDHYTSIIDKKTQKPIYNEKNVVSGNATWEQWTNYNFDSMTVDVKVLDYKREDPNRAWKVKLEENTQDVLGTFMFFKHYDWISMKIGDSVMLTTHYEKKLYKVGVRYMGQHIIEFNDRYVGTYKLHLLLPENDKLKKDRPVEIFISSDKNQYPLLIETKLPFLGKGRVELVELNNGEPIF